VPTNASRPRVDVPRVAGIAIIALLALALGWWSLIRSEGETPAPTAGTTTLDGRSLYQTYCAGCHGARGEGQPDWKTKKPDGVYPAPPHDASGHTWHHTDGLLFRIVRNGGQATGPADFKSGMPAMKDTLSDAQIIATLEYIKTFWGPDEREFQSGITRNDRYPGR
jgi:mono/diheme cytochrome c family protein